MSKYIVTEFCSFSVRDLIAYEYDEVEGEEQLAWHIITPIIEAIAHIHSLGVVHRDIKPENILIDWKGIPKLANFGFACKVDELVFDNTGPGTEGYFAPEACRGEKYGVPVDIFALGYTVLELQNRESKIPEKNLIKLYNERHPRKRKNMSSSTELKRFRDNFHINGKVSDKNKTEWKYYNKYLLQKMITICIYPSNRISAKELCKEPLIKTFIKAWDGKLQEVFKYNTMLLNRVIKDRKLSVRVPFVNQHY